MGLIQRRKLHSTTWNLDRLIELLTEARNACRAYAPEILVETYSSGSLSVLSSQGERLMFLYMDPERGRAILRPHSDDIVGNVAPIQPYIHIEKESDDGTE